jgi:hypothetical protein
MVVAIGVVALQAGRVDGQATPPNIPRPGDTLIVMTVPLKHISSKAAVDLLGPYASPQRGGGVYAMPNMRAVTIRETAASYARMLKVLSEYDRSPATISLYFQLIAAEKVPGERPPARDPSLAALDSLLRDVLKFNNYRLLGTAVASATEGDRVIQTISGDDERLTLEVWLSDAPGEGGEGSVHLNVELRRRIVASANMSQKSATYGNEAILMTGVNVPIGQTVVLGTAAQSNASKALILTVKPQLAAIKTKRDE